MYETNRAGIIPGSATVSLGKLPNLSELSDPLPPTRDKVWLLSSFRKTKLTDPVQTLPQSRGLLSK